MIENQIDKYTNSSKVNGKRTKPNSTSNTNSKMYLRFLDIKTSSNKFQTLS